MTPGAPNRPPEAAPPAPPTTPPVVEPADVKLRRRLVPSHVALLLDLWKGAVPPEVAGPYDRAVAALHGGDFAAATQALDQLSIRFAEPRWPSLPEPFHKLRVPIPAPVPPHWDPDHGLAAPEKEARQARRAAADQLALAEASVRWAEAHGVATDGLGASLLSAKGALDAGADLPTFYGPIDTVWRTLEAALPAPKRSAKGAAPAPAESA